MIRAVAVASSHDCGGVVDNAADSCSRVLGSILAVNFDMHERGILGLWTLWLLYDAGFESKSYLFVSGQ